jgi:ATP-dependent DNA ligase
MALWTRRSGIQLAYPFEAKRLTKYSQPYLVQPKLNGERCRALITNRGVTLLSSEENEIITLPHINKVLALSTKIELDGEVYLHGMSKQAISSFMRRKTPHPDHFQMQYHVFDIIHEELSQMERLRYLYADFRSLLEATGCVKVVDTHRVWDMEGIEKLLHFYCGEGYEGIIIREANALYERTRTTNMLKWKPRHKDSYLIVGYQEEVDKYGTPKGRLGSLECEKDDQRFSVGSGSLLTHANRNDLWAIRDGLLGQYALIKYPELTDRGVPNHPVIVGITEREEEDE